MKHRILWLAVVLTACLLGGCKNTDASAAEPQAENVQEADKDEAQEEAVQEPEAANQEEPEQTPQETVQHEEEGFSFADVANREFYFSSGAGGWYTVLYIHEDGTFDGHYQDSDMGVTGEGYPNGTLYYCDFYGSFTQPEKVDDTTYVFELESIEYPMGFGDEIKDGIHYCYTDAYGLSGAKELYMYLPGSVLAELPEAYRSWVGYYNLESVSGTHLPFYGLYNMAEEEGFSSYVMSDVSSEQVEAVLREAEEKTSTLQERFDGASSQMELNEISQEMYEVWDDALNEIWGILKENLDENTMTALTEEERNWIAEKEEAVQEAGAEYEGGSMQAMVISQEAERLTRARAYVLSGYLH